VVVVAKMCTTTTLAVGLFAFLVCVLFLVVLGCVEWDSLHNAMLDVCWLVVLWLCNYVEFLILRYVENTSFLTKQLVSFVQFIFHRLFTNNL
jgi:hypothetical protein